MSDESRLDKYKSEVTAKLKELLPEEIQSFYILETVADFYVALPYIDHSKPIREDNLLMVIAFLCLAQIQYKKEGTYGRSWCKRGELDVFFNTARKFDRIENMMINGAKDEVGESHVDTVGDLSNYGMLWMTYIIRNHPEAFLAWNQNN